MAAQTDTEISFEFFPPKTDKAKINLANSIKELSKFNSKYFSVTFGANGSNQNGTIETVNWLKRDTTNEIAPHISGMVNSKEEFSSILNLYRSIGIKRIIVLRGDLPESNQNNSCFKFASQIVKFIKNKYSNYFHISVAAYPEFHPEAFSANSDIQSLKNKRDAGANSAITQYFYNPDAYFYFIDKCVKEKIFMPVIPGIMPITNYENLSRFSERCGAEIPRWLKWRLESYGDDHESVKAFGLEVLYNLCQKLLAGGAPGLHFYTLNQFEILASLLEELNLSKQNDFSLIAK